jgi:hypothetical protein
LTYEHRIHSNIQRHADNETIVSKVKEMTGLDFTVKTITNG